MFCGSCLRDNTLATELRRQGHDVTLVCIYSSTRTDEPNVSEERVLFGGINVYLQQVLPFFRQSPTFVDKLFDSAWMMRLLGRLSLSTDAARLGELTVSTLKGEHGYQRKEVAKLTKWVSSEPRPDVILLPNSLMIGIARSLRSAIGAPIVCTLQGEDLFLDGMCETLRREAISLIRGQVRFVDGFHAVSSYYAKYMGKLLDIPAHKMAVVPIGINLDGFDFSVEEEGPLSIGYFARISPEKGLHNLCEAYRLLRKRRDLPPTRLEVAGYLGREHRGYLSGLEGEMSRHGLAREFRYHGVLDRKEKIAFLRSLAIASVPTDCEEPKGLFLLEAMACGVPVVQPRRGAFEEVLTRTGGGRLVEAGNNQALADVLAELVVDREQRRDLGRRGAEGVRQHYSASNMARSAITSIEKWIRRERIQLPPSRFSGAETR